MLDALDGGEALVAPARVHEQEIRRMASPRRPAAFLRRLETQLAASGKKHVMFYAHGFSIDPTTAIQDATDIMTELDVDYVLGRVILCLRSRREIVTR